MITVEALENIGYEITLKGDKVVYKYQGEEKPDPAIVLPLLEELKAKRQEAIVYLSAQAKAGKEEPRECFDPDGYLQKLLAWAKETGKTDSEVAKAIDSVISVGTLKAPWGIKIKNSPILGDYWIVSDDQARKHIPSNEVVFTAEDIRLLAEVREIFGARVIEVKERE